MKILVTGARGQLGTDLTEELGRRGIETIPADLPDTDITDTQSLTALFDRERPDAVIHAAAYTAVDKAESEKELCRAVNVEGTRNISRLCGERGIKLVFTSTDYVFGSDGDELLETDSPCAPLNYYGETKLEAENIIRELCPLHFIVRISWVFGVHGKNFVYTMLRLADERECLTVVDDQIGSPTYTRDLAPLLCEMAASDKYGTYHATNEGFCSFYDYAREIFALAGKSTVVKPVKTAEYVTPARRQLNSRLSKKSLDEAGFARLPDYHDALRDFLTRAGYIQHIDK